MNKDNNLQINTDILEKKARQTEEKYLDKIRKKEYADARKLHNEADKYWKQIQKLELQKHFLTK